MQIDLDKFDQVSKMENQLEKLIKIVSLSEYETYPLNKENKLIFALTIISILYKEKIYNEHLYEQLQALKPIIAYEIEDYNNTLEDIIMDLKQSLEENDLLSILEKIKEYGEELNIALSNYFERSKMNYILKKTPMDLIEQQEKVKEILELNPFIINECLKQKKLTEEEKIISDIIGYYNEAITKDEELNTIKKLMIQNYNKKELHKAILFIIGNIYQEMLEDKTEINTKIKYIMETEEIMKEEIIEHFINNDSFSNECFEYFLVYNLNIKENRLEELKEKTSYKSVIKKFRQY